jgi:hypothetical protein
MEFKTLLLFLLNGSSSGGCRTTANNNNKINNINTKNEKFIKNLFSYSNKNNTMVNKRYLRINSYNIFPNMFILQQNWWFFIYSLVLMLIMFNRTVNGSCLFNQVEYKVMFTY